MQDSTTPESDQGQIAAQDTAETSVSEKKKDDEETDKGKEKEKEKDGEIKTEIEKEKLCVPEGTNFDGLIQRLPGCVSRDLIDQLTVMFYGLAVVTFRIAVPAGQFVPGIMIGSTYGHLVGRHSLSDFVKPVSSKGLSICDIHLTPDDLEALEETRLKQK
ncbi:unnamed protein product [Lactuca saligna]|uniref:Uncharacterized protein n=1 Tax=Lactuca saligna TaxID=75948 RepID=A0AA36EEZ8_LACSI|nr:unnamed protein product [Lactuca saligna]